jgi:hypothetical protein
MTLRRVERLQAMLPDRDGLWLIEGRRVHAVAGRALGAAITLPYGLRVAATAVASNLSWAIAYSRRGRSPLLLELDLRELRVTSAPLETEAPLLNGLVRAGRELWTADPVGVRILRFDGRGRRLGAIRLRPVAGYEYRYPFLILSAGARYVWASANKPPFALYRITVPSYR